MSESNLSMVQGNPKAITLFELVQFLSFYKQTTVFWDFNGKTNPQRHTIVKSEEKIFMLLKSFDKSSDNSKKICYNQVVEYFHNL